MNRLLVFLKGMAMGAADVVPGVSGGTIAFISGIYEELLDSLRSVNLVALKLLLTGKFKSFWRHINGRFLFPLFLGIGLSILSLAKLIGYLLENHPILIWSFFFGLIIASVVFIGRQIPQWNWRIVLALLIGTVTAYWITIASPSSMPEGYLFLFIAGAIAICAMILPGISGSFILLLLGAYSGVLGAVNGLSAGEEGGGFTANAIKLLFFMLGCVVGLLSFSHFLSWLFKRARNTTIAVLTGFMLGSLNKVWPWKETVSTRINSHGEEVPFMQENILPADFAILTGESHQLMWAVLCCLAGFAIVFVLEGIGGRQKDLA